MRHTISAQVILVITDNLTQKLIKRTPDMRISYNSIADCGELR